MLSTMPQRREARVWAAARPAAGLPCASMRSFQDAASELALLRAADAPQRRRRARPRRRARAARGAERARRREFARGAVLACRPVRHPRARPSRLIGPDLVDLRRRLHQHPRARAAPARSPRAWCSTRWRASTSRSPLGQGALLGHRGAARARRRPAVGRPPGRAAARRHGRAAGDRGARRSTTSRSHAGLMHACGHDLHVAGLVGAARVLHELRDELAGDVVFMFQPGEEGPGGAEPMIAEGLLDAAGPPRRRGIRPARLLRRAPARACGSAVPAR